MGEQTGTSLLSPLTIRGVTFRNRIAMSPMCQYCAVDGLADDWHLVHLGSRAVGGAGLVFVEATAVVPEGRIAPGDLGIWDDQHIEPLARVVRFLTRMGAVPALQLAHAGRKASTLAPYHGVGGLRADQGAWQTIAPSTIPFGEKYQVPRAMEKNDIEQIVAAFAAAGRRAVRAGFRVVEIHAAHGYLIHQFLSPLTNHRRDDYGGILENRMRLALEIVTAVRDALTDDMPLFVRISCTDWHDGGWDLEQSIALAKRLQPLGVDLIDASSGGLVPGVKIPLGPGYQVPFASAIRERAKIMTGAVGLITEPHQANEIIVSGKADIVIMAREMLREPYWALKAQQALGQDPDWPLQYGWAVRKPKN
jgi:2,4-dienoyl-CoA reductase-like NADH-dependent reductase (Old Yellow Enzyme family)